MIEAWTAREVYAAEDALLTELPDGELMARAVAGLAQVVATRMQERGARRVVALVGPGNNGADALYAAATLARLGFLAAAVTTDRVHAGAAADAHAAGVARVEDPAASVQVVAEADVVLDGILGIGGRATLPEHAVAWVAAIPADAYVVAVDTPSGQPVDGDGEHEVNPEGVFADETVTFSLRKPVHLLPRTEAACGQVTVVDIGISTPAPPAVLRVTAEDVPRWWPVPTVTDDKYSRGVVGIVAGSQRYPGAAVLATTAAAEAGAGMIRYIGPSTPAGLVLAAVPEAVHGTGRVQAWVIGPGIDPGQVDPGQQAAVEQALASAEPVLVDAGALDLLTLEVLRSRRDRVTLLTPHAGECARLLSRLTGQLVERDRVEANPVHQLRALAQITGATVLLKGSTTTIGGPSGPVFSQADAPAWLSTAGAGDVLAGLAGVLLACGLAPAPAGALAAFVHGRSAEAANPGGPIRALAVAHSISRVLARLLAR